MIKNIVIATLAFSLALTFSAVVASADSSKTTVSPLPTPLYSLPH